MNFIEQLKIKFKEFSERERLRKKVYQEEYEKEHLEQLKLKAKRDAEDKFKRKKESDSIFGGKTMQIGDVNDKGF